jgi:hypothetical protein
MFRRNAVHLAMIVLAVGVALPLWAADDDKTGNNRTAPDAEQKAQKNPSAEAVAALGMAHQLAQFGRQHKSPLALLAAAEVIASIPTGKLDAKPKSQADGKAEGAQKKADRPEETAVSLVAEARKLGGSDEQVQALAAKVSEKLAEKSRGAVGGPKRAVTSVQALTTDVYNIPFRGGEVAAIVVSGDGDTDLDLYVYDENGNLIAGDDSYSDDCGVRWIPKWTGPFTIHVRNRGRVYNNYILLTN